MSVILYTPFFINKALTYSMSDVAVKQRLQKKMQDIKDKKDIAAKRQIHTKNQLENIHTLPPQTDNSNGRCLKGVAQAVRLD